jgi:hypothetical protein
MRQRRCRCRTNRWRHRVRRAPVGCPLARQQELAFAGHWKSNGQFSACERAAPGGTHRCAFHQGRVREFCARPASHRIRNQTSGIFGRPMRALTKAPVLLRGETANLDVDQAHRLAEWLVATEMRALDPRSDRIDAPFVGEHALEPQEFLASPGRVAERRAPACPPPVGPVRTLELRRSYRFETSGPMRPGA